ncbi:MULTISPECIES: LptA/OstA family protein [unclassified Veillonella]|uniref:LptA/OstA family protein n=1 Tax=unclassified Veillonella TaxID=2630086 RepID=UPI001389D1BA|nr:MULTISPECIES: LptA/OstA family protein [unclassified Veillonella]KAF1683948.1 OstA-like protein [Veillonella sp. R32]
MKLSKVMAITALAASIAVPAWAATSNMTITADVLQYDGNSGLAQAKGNVVIINEDKTMTGKEGWYNTKTQEARLTGGISMIGTDTSMSAQELHSTNNEQLEAKGNVRLQKENKQVFGDIVTYNTKTEYGTSRGHGKLVMDDAVLTGDYIEGWLGQIRATAQGNVTLHSAKHNLDASADNAVYTQTPGQDDGVAYLTGNAHAVQNGNVLNAPELKLEMKDNSVQTVGGRSTLVITPQQ